MAQAISKKRKIFDGRYEIIEIVGRGSGSVVYRARHLNNLENEVALKVLLEKKGGGSNSTRLRKEALAMVTSRHPHVIRLDDFHSVDALCYLSMQYAPESDLRKYTKKMGGTLSPEQGERFLTQIADALAFMHHSNILHRDIKPDNILIINDQEAKLADFGVALLPNQKSSLQELQNGVGTLDYMAPEIFEGTGCDKEADIYLLGVSFYEMLTGHQPFRDVPLVEVLNVRQDDQVTPLQELAPDVPNYLAHVIEKAMAYDPLARYRSGEEMYEDLLRQRAAAEQGIILPESGGPRRERKATLSVIEGAQGKVSPDEKHHEAVAKEQSEEVLEATESVQEHQEQDEAVNSSGIDVNTPSESDSESKSESENESDGTARRKRRRRRRRRRDQEQKVVKFFGDSEDSDSDGTPVAANVLAEGPDPIAAYTVEEAIEETTRQEAKQEVASPVKEEKKGHRFPDPQDPVQSIQEAPVSAKLQKEVQASPDAKKADKKQSGTTEMLSQEAEELIAHLEKMLQEDEDFKNLMEENAAKEHAKASPASDKDSAADSSVSKSQAVNSEPATPEAEESDDDDFQAAQDELEQVAEQSIDEELLAILKEKEPALAAPKASPTTNPAPRQHAAASQAPAPKERKIESPVRETPVEQDYTKVEQNPVAPGETGASVEVNSWLYQEGSDVKKNSDNVDTIDEVDEIKVASDLYADDELPLEETYEDFSERVSYTAQDDEDDEGQYFYKPDQQYDKRHMNTANPALNKKHRFIGFLVVIVASIFIGDFYLRSKTNRGLADRAYDIIGYKNSQIVPSVSGQLSFPYMPSGIYTGSIANLIPSLRLPLTLISLQEREKVVVMIGIEGWQPAVVSLTTEPGESIADFRVAANGFVLRMSGKVEGGKIVGTYKNSVTQESGTWEVVPVR